MNSTSLYILLSLLFTLKAVAFDAYSIREIQLPNWTEDREINAIQQDQLGLLWLGTNQGLYRYDGSNVVSYQHEPFDPRSLRSNVINTLFVNHSSRLLLGTEKGLHRYVTSSNYFERYEFGEEVNVGYITEDLHDYLWFWTDKGLFWLYHEPGTDYYWGKADLPDDLIDPDQEILSVFISPDDVMWLATSNGLFVFSVEERCSPELLFSDDRFTRHREHGEVHAITRDIQGRTWIGTSRETFTVTNDNYGVQTVKGQDGMTNLAVRDIVLSPSGTLFLNSQNVIYSLSRDSDDERIEALDLNYGFFWPTEKIIGIKEDKLNAQNLFLLLDNHKLRYLEKAEVKTEAIDLFLNLSHKDAIIVGNHIVTCGRTNEFQLYGNNSQTPIFQGIVSKDINELRDVLLDDNKCYFLWPHKIEILNTDNSSSSEIVEFGDVALNCFEMVGNRLWLGTACHGILTYNIGEWSQPVDSFSHDVSRTSSLPSDCIIDMKYDVREGLWIATTEGLCQGKIGDAGLFRTYRRVDGLPHHHVKSLTFDSLSNLWVLTRNGPCIYQKVDDRFHMIKGVHSSQFDPRSICFVDGSIVLAKDREVVSVASENIQFNKELVPVRFAELFDASGRQIYLLHRVPEKEIIVPYEHNSLLVEFVTIQPSTSYDYDFKYFLDGEREERGDLHGAQSISLNSLSSGHYELTISALDDRGLLRGQDRIKFAVTRPFWLSNMFFSLIVLLILVLIGAYKLIISDQRRKRLAAIKDIQKQTAADFHDELGSRLTVISLYSNMIRRKKDIGSLDSDAYLDKVLDSANDLYFAMKDVIWSLKPEAESMDGLYDHIAELGERMFETSEIKFSATRLSPVPALKLSKIVSKNITLIFREALNNALKHSGGSSVRLLFNAENSIFIISCCDDGHGIHNDNHKGEGLVNMRMRAKQISGDLQIDSSTEGTEVKLAIAI